MISSSAPNKSSQGRPATRERMERAHALESRAGGPLSLALASGRGLSGAKVREWVALLREAADELESIVGASKE